MMGLFCCFRGGAEPSGGAATADGSLSSKKKNLADRKKSCTDSTDSAQAATSHPGAGRGDNNVHVGKGTSTRDLPLQSQGTKRQPHAAKHEDDEVALYERHVEKQRQAEAEAAAIRSMQQQQQQQQETSASQPAGQHTAMGISDMAGRLTSARVPAATEHAAGSLAGASAAAGVTLEDGPAAPVSHAASQAAAAVALQDSAQEDAAVGPAAVAAVAVAAMEEEAGLAVGAGSPPAGGVGQMSAAEYRAKVLAAVAEQATGKAGPKREPPPGNIYIDTAHDGEDVQKAAAHVPNAKYRAKVIAAVAAIRAGKAAALAKEEAAQRDAASEQPQVEAIAMEHRAVAAAADVANEGAVLDFSAVKQSAAATTVAAADPMAQNDGAMKPALAAAAVTAAEEASQKVVHQDSPSMVASAEAVDMTNLLEGYEEVPTGPAALAAAQAAGVAAGAAAAAAFLAELVHDDGSAGLTEAVAAPATDIGFVPDADLEPTVGAEVTAMLVSEDRVAPKIVAEQQSGATAAVTEPRGALPGPEPVAAAAAANHQTDIPQKQVYTPPAAAEAAPTTAPAQADTLSKHSLEVTPREVPAASFLASSMVSPGTPALMARPSSYTMTPCTLLPSSGSSSASGEVAAEDMAVEEASMAAVLVAGVVPDESGMEGECTEPSAEASSPASVLGLDTFLDSLSKRAAASTADGSEATTTSSSTVKSFWACMKEVALLDSARFAMVLSQQQDSDALLLSQQLERDSIVLSEHAQRDERMLSQQQQRHADVLTQQRYRDSDTLLSQQRADADMLSQQRQRDLTHLLSQKQTDAQLLGQHRRQDFALMSQESGRHADMLCQQGDRDLDLLHGQADRDSHLLHQQVDRDSLYLYDQVGRDSQLLHELVNHDSHLLHSQADRDRQVLSQQQAMLQAH